jgi:hypothetical protein
MKKQGSRQLPGMTMSKIHTTQPETDPVFMEFMLSALIADLPKLQ